MNNITKLKTFLNRTYDILGPEEFKEYIEIVAKTSKSETLRKLVTQILEERKKTQ